MKSIIFHIISGLPIREKHTALLRLVFLCWAQVIVTHRCRCRRVLLRHDSSPTGARHHGQPLRRARHAEDTLRDGPFRIAMRAAYRHRPLADDGLTQVATHQRESPGDVLHAPPAGSSTR